MVLGTMQWSHVSRLM
ncbi:unnamed protein product, partial [Rotaria sp. Silwood1]